MPFDFCSRHPKVFIFIQTRAYHFTADTLKFLFSYKQGQNFDKSGEISLEISAA